MNPNVYQAAAARSECDQDKAASRMESLLPVDPNSSDSLHLMPVRINHAVVGLAGEVGELAQLLERWVYYGQSLPIPDVEEEVGDCLWYLALLCTAVGIPMERAMEGNIAKLKARFPHKFTEEAAANRDPTAERKAADEAMERAKAEWVSAYADGLKQLTERYGGVSSKPVSEIYPTPAAGNSVPVPEKPINLSNASQPGVVLLGGIPVPGVWACECGQINADCRMFCGCCNKRRKGQEDWLCECGHINLAIDPRCVKCENPRLTTVLQEQQDNLVRQVEETTDRSPQEKDEPKSLTVDSTYLGSLKPQAQSEGKGHDWKDPTRAQTTCTKCGAYRHLGSGTMRCKGRPPDQENPFGYDEAGEFEDL